MVAMLTERAPGVIRWLNGLGVTFDQHLSGEFALGLEGAHRHRRILHAGGDATGRKVMEVILAALQQIPTIQRETNIQVLGLAQRRDGSVAGAWGQSACHPGQPILFRARRATILATGGVGQLYLRSTNPVGASGDGIALAYCAGAPVRNLEFVQFHPTALDDNEQQCFLISEAVRGAGGVLVDGDGTPIMQDHPLRDLAPRDVVARVIYQYITRRQPVYLDCRRISGFAELFPTIYRHCVSRGRNPAVDLLPVSPAAHFMMGGVLAEMDGTTGVSGLYAIGEVASTGVHGANRLASNSLLECVTMALTLADSMKRSTMVYRKTDMHLDVEDPIALFTPDAPEVIREVQSVMWAAAGIVRDEMSLLAGLEQLNILSERYPQSPSVITARCIVQSALLRKESRGAHYRLDYPSQRPELNGWDNVLSQSGRSPV